MVNVGFVEQLDLSVANSVEESPEPTREIRVMLVDDQPIVRMGMRAGLERFGGIVIDCEAQDGDSTLSLAAQRPVDVCLLDVRLPDVDGLEVAERLREVAPAMRVILISGEFGLAAIERAVRAGVNGIVLKTELPQRLAIFVRDVFRGEYRCSRQLEEWLQPGPEGFQIASGSCPVLTNLSAREREMLVALANGASLKQAASTLGVTYKSADHLKQSVMKKLRIHDRVELARFAVREGLVT